MVISGWSMGHPWLSLDYPWFIHGYHWITPRAVHGYHWIVHGPSMDIIGLPMVHPWLPLDYRSTIAARHSGHIGTPHNRRKTFGVHWHAPQSQEDIRGTLARPLTAGRHYGYIATPVP